MAKNEAKTKISFNQKFQSANETIVVVVGFVDKSKYAACWTNLIFPRYILEIYLLFLPLIFTYQRDWINLFRNDNIQLPEMGPKCMVVEFHLTKSSLGFVELYTANDCLLFLLRACCFNEQVMACNTKNTVYEQDNNDEDNNDDDDDLDEEDEYKWLI